MSHRGYAGAATSPLLTEPTSKLRVIKQIRLAVEAEAPDECLAGAELMLRTHWGAVERLAATLRSVGEITPHAIGLVHMALEGPQRVLAADADALLGLLTTVEHLPEFARQIEDALRALNARAA